MIYVTNSPSKEQLRLVKRGESWSIARVEAIEAVQGSRLQPRVGQDDEGSYDPRHAARRSAAPHMRQERMAGCHAPTYGSRITLEARGVYGLMLFASASTLQAYNISICHDCVHIRMRSWLGALRCRGKSLPSSRIRR